LTDVFALAPRVPGVYFKARDTHAVWYLPLQQAGGEAGGEPTPTGLPLTGSGIQQLAIANDGRRIAWTTVDQTSNIWSVSLSAQAEKDRAPVALTDGSGIRFGMPAVSPDGRVAMVGSTPGSPTSIFLLEPRAPLRQLLSHPPMHGVPLWRPGERDLAFVTDHGRGPGLWRLDPETGREELLFLFSDLPRVPGAGPANMVGAALSTGFSSDFKSLAFAAQRDGIPNIWVVSLGNPGTPRQLVQRTFERQGGTFPSWSPDNRWIAYQCADGSDTQLCVTPADGGARVQLTKGPGQSWTGGWSPDSEQILTAARRNAVWNVAVVSRTTGTVRMLTHFSEPRVYVRYPRWDSRNHRAVFERADAIGKIWAVEVVR
jgi:Tol biopolymer transport system component